ncbi:MAG: hypothetical protein ACYTXC_23420, partial [Nostoc sp.]
MKILFSQKFRFTVGCAGLLLATLASSYLYTQSKTKQLAQQNQSFTQPENFTPLQSQTSLTSTFQNPFIALSNQMRYILSPLLACGEGVGGGVVLPHSTENCYTNQQISDEIIGTQNAFSSRQDLISKSTPYPVVDEFKKYKFSINGSQVFSPVQLPTSKVNFNQADLLTVLVNTRKYFQDYTAEDPDILRTGILATQGVTVTDVLKTLDFMIAILKEDIANNRATRLQDPKFI